MIKIRLKISSVPLLIHDVAVQGNIGALSGCYVLKVLLSLTLAKILAVGVQLALASRMRMLLDMPRDRARSFCLSFAGGTSVVVAVVVVPLLAFLVTFLVDIVVEILALALKERILMARHVSAKLLGVVRVYVLVPDQPALLVIEKGTPRC